MKKFSGVLFAAVILVSVVLLIGSGRDRVIAQQKPAEPPSGRYQVFKSVRFPNSDCLLDTATGKLWTLETPDGGTKWHWYLKVAAPK